VAVTTEGKKNRNKARFGLPQFAAADQSFILRKAVFLDKIVSTLSGFPVSAELYLEKYAVLLE